MRNDSRGDGPGVDGFGVAYRSGTDACTCRLDPNADARAPEPWPAPAAAVGRDRPIQPTHEWSLPEAGTAGTRQRLTGVSRGGLLPLHPLWPGA